uniref:Twinkle protein putative n=1 Tax=Albugo laibachii Nc14 TaxID=890382 RepID=F0WGW8_9STRA|nr:twinkle protein putative [Albugo laibachii Nc14]|eukprot:CCA20483.1 twinkle protein putative [Albugo laibachii Nc14]
MWRFCRTIRSTGSRNRCRCVPQTSSQGPEPFGIATNELRYSHTNNSVNRRRFVTTLKQSVSSQHFSTFTSRFYELQDAKTEIPSFLQRKSLQFRDSATHFIIRTCPFCHETHGKADNLFKLYVDKLKGVFKCHRCGQAGSWLDFKRRCQSSNQAQSGSFHIHQSQDIVSGSANNPQSTFSSSPNLSIRALDGAKAIEIQDNLWKEDSFGDVLRYLTKERLIFPETLVKYGVGAIEQTFRSENSTEAQGYQCITFPWMARTSDLKEMGVEVVEETSEQDDHNAYHVVRLKTRALGDKSKQRLIPKGGSWGLFGWNTVPADADEIVLTEGEFDAMTVYQATGKPAVSLPNGCQSLPPSILPLLERFKKIYLWMDNDAQGQANVSKFTIKLGQSRCHIVRMASAALPKSCNIKDANEAYREKIDLAKLLAQAERIPHAQIATFEHLRQQVFEEILNPIRLRGVQSRSLPSLNRLLKGHRLGEVTILTGPTGCGKTTLLSQLSLDLCGQGVSTLWGSFEIQNTRLIHKMMTQLAGKSLQGDPAAFEIAADSFEDLPMYFLRFFGTTDVDELMDAVEYAVYAYDVQHILLDNVQFMMAGQGRGFDKFERQDAALDKFRRFATQKNVHITLVIHPRKEAEGQDLSLSSVFGTAKATQEADNVLILQRIRGQSRLDVRKNRFDGSLGSVPLQYDSESGCLKEWNEFPMDEELGAIELEAQQTLRQKKMNQRSELSNDASMDHLLVTTAMDEDMIVPEIVTQPGYRRPNGQAEPFARFTPIIAG